MTGAGHRFLQWGPTTAGEPGTAALAPVEANPNPFQRNQTETGNTLEPTLATFGCPDVASRPARTAGFVHLPGPLPP